MLLDNLEKIVIIGLGGIGGYTIGPLARFLRSKTFTGDIILVDGDTYEQKNLDRQMFGNEWMGTNKAEYHALVTKTHLPELESQISHINSYIGEHDIKKLITDDTLVITAVDNSAVRKFVQDRCAELKNVVHICAGNDLVTGQVQIYAKADNKELTPSIYERSPDFNSTDDDRSALTCNELHDLDGGSQTIFANMFAATQVLNFVNMVWTNKIFCDSVFFNCNTGGSKPTGTVTHEPNFAEG